MRIAVDVRSLMEERHSGVQEYVVQLLRALGRIAPQHEYHLFYNSWRHVSMPDFDGPFTFVPFHYPNKTLNLSQLLTGQPRWDSLVEADVFFVPNVRLMPLSRRAPLVVTAHDLSFERFPEFYSWRRRAWHQVMRPRHLMQNADHIIAVSESTAADVHDLYGIQQHKVSVIHSGVTTPLPTAQLPPRWQLPKHFVLYLGTVEPRKNVVSIINAFSAVADRVPHDLVLAGADGWLTRDVTQAYRRSPVADRIHRLGPVSEGEKAALYAAADLFVYPSFYEGFGFPPLEALLAGTPVITSMNSALPEVVGEWATLVDPYNPAELAVVMHELLDDPPLISPQDRRAVAERFSWDRAARQTLRILEQVA